VSPEAQTDFFVSIFRKTRSPSAPRWISTPPPIDHAEGGGTGAAEAGWLVGTSAGWLGGGGSGPTRTPGSWRERGCATTARVGRSGLELDGKRQNGKNSGWGSHLGGRGEQWWRGLCFGEEVCALGRQRRRVVVRFLTRWRRRLRRFGFASGACGRRVREWVVPRAVGGEE
jgi:hypothetical protein